MAWKINVGYTAVPVTKALYCSLVEVMRNVSTLFSSGHLWACLFGCADFIKRLERRALTPESLNPAERLHARACLRAHSQPEALLLGSPSLCPEVWCIHKIKKCQTIVPIVNLPSSGNFEREEPWSCYLPTPPQKGCINYLDLLITEKARHTCHVSQQKVA